MAVISLSAMIAGCTGTGQQNDYNMAELNLTKQWDKKFPQSDKVNHRKVTFKNRYGITLAADLYEPANKDEKLPAIAVSGPFGAVKEQASGLYAQTTEHGARQWSFPSSICPCCHTFTKSQAQCCLSMERMPIPAISVKMHTDSCAAATKS